MGPEGGCAVSHVFLNAWGFESPDFVKWAMCISQTAVFGVSGPSFRKSNFSVLNSPIFSFRRKNTALSCGVFCVASFINTSWSGLRGSNSLPPPWQGGALPDELSPRNKKYYSKTSLFCQAFFTFFSIVFSMSFKEPITAPVLLKMPPIPSEHPTAPQPPALLDTPEFLPPWA